LFAPSILSSVLRQRADLYHFHNPGLFLVGLLLKLVFRRRVVYDVEEDFPSMMATKPWIPRLLRPLAAKAVEIVERLVVACMDGVVTADPLTLRRLASVGRCRKLVFYNFPNLDFFPDPASGPKAFDVVYRGGLSDRTGLPLLLESLRMLVESGRPGRLLLIGYFDDSRSKELLLRRIRDLGLERWIELRGRIEHHSMAQALSQARVGVCPLQPIPKFLRNIPVKVWEYWACGLPVVASDLPPIRPFFRNHESGLLFEPGDVCALSQAIGWLLDHPSEATQMGMRGRQAVLERYNNSQEVQKLLSFYQCILER
jgi:glycosyltransferase involved in cell wall biosynthesis